MYSHCHCGDRHPGFVVCDGFFASGSFEASLPVRTTGPSSSLGTLFVIIAWSRSQRRRSSAYIQLSSASPGSVSPWRPVVSHLFLLRQVDRRSTHLRWMLWDAWWISTLLRNPAGIRSFAAGHFPTVPRTHVSDCIGNSSPWQRRVRFLQTLWHPEFQSRTEACRSRKAPDVSISCILLRAKIQ